MFQENPLSKQISRAIKGTSFIEYTYTSTKKETKGIKFTEYILEPSEVEKIYVATNSNKNEKLQDVFVKFFREHYGASKSLPNGGAVITVAAELFGFIKVPLKSLGLEQTGGSN